MKAGLGMKPRAGFAESRQRRIGMDGVDGELGEETPQGGLEHNHTDM